MKSLWSRLITGLVVFGMYLMLTNAFDIQEVITAAVIALVLAMLPLPGSGVWGQISLAPRRVFFAVIYAFVFIRALILSNLDVAYRVIMPRIPINPGVVRVRTNLKSPLGRLVLANSITLTPGTITVDINDDILVIHWINRTHSDIEGATKAIVSGFEKYLEVIFD